MLPDGEQTVQRGSRALKLSLQPRKRSLLLWHGRHCAVPMANFLPDLVFRRHEGRAITLCAVP